MSKRRRDKIASFKHMFECGRYVVWIWWKVFKWMWTKVKERQGKGSSKINILIYGNGITEPTWCHSYSYFGETLKAINIIPYESLENVKTCYNKSFSISNRTCNVIFIKSSFCSIPNAPFFLKVREVLDVICNSCCNQRYK